MNALATFPAIDLGEAPMSMRTDSSELLSEGVSSDVSVRRLIGLDTIVVSKSEPGFDAAAVEVCLSAVRECARGGRVKFLMFDFAQTEEADAEAADGFGELVSQVANLILRTSIVSIAVTRGPMRGADLELALACNILIGEEGATFKFDADPLASVRTYAFLAQKIGFVRAERLMENAQVLDTEEMKALMLLKEVLAPGSVAQGLSDVMRKYLRRHNFYYGMHRAQRITSPYVHQFDAPAQFS
jgi:enoyl-CoA hydratase/carnithine racemase